MLARSKRIYRRIVKGLVLTRSEGEDIQIDLPDGQMIVVQIVRVDRGKVRLLTQAPETCKIRRGELVAADAA